MIDETHSALAPSGARALLSAAWQAVLGEPAPPHGVALFTAQGGLETDSGRSMPGNNFGGIKAGPSAAGASFRTVEGYGAGRREIRARFRVYATPELGARRYVELLATKYPEALAAARAGDVGAFAHALAKGGYYTADPKAYGRGLELRLAQLSSAAADPAPATAAHATWLQESALAGLLRALARSDADA